MIAKLPSTALPCRGPIALPGRLVLDAYLASMAQRRRRNHP